MMSVAENIAIASLLRLGRRVQTAEVGHVSLGGRHGRSDFQFAGWYDGGVDGWEVEVGSCRLWSRDARVTRRMHRPERSWAVVVVHVRR